MLQLLHKALLHIHIKLPIPVQDVACSSNDPPCKPKPCGRWKYPCWMQSIPRPFRHNMIHVLYQIILNSKNIFFKLLIRRIQFLGWFSGTHFFKTGWRCLWILIQIMFCLVIQSGFQFKIQSHLGWICIMGRISVTWLSMSWSWFRRVWPITTQLLGRGYSHLYNEVKQNI